MKLKVIVPVVLPSKGGDRKRTEILDAYKSVSRDDVEWGIVNLDQGPESIESKYDEALAQPDVVRKIQEAEEQGFDACIIDCFGDPGLYAAREVVHIPVVGAGQSAMFLAAMLSRRFSVITVLAKTVPLIEDNARVYNINSKLASVRAVNIPVLQLPVLQLQSRKSELIERLSAEGSSAVEEEGAEAIVLGCTGMAGLTEAVKESLHRKGLKALVIDPVQAAVKVAESLVDLNLMKKEVHIPHLEGQI